ncbi:MAG: WGR domain-containing protein [Phycisphaera sp. RhM]|nr:WGR domain-containing protein [Phycisphaera sp. RhM]
MPIRRFYHARGGKLTFWYIETRGKKQTVRTGEIGTKGRIATKEFESIRDARADAKSKAERKAKLGFVEYPPDVSSAPMANRRGAWDGWHETTWSVCLIRSRDQDLIAALNSCPSVLSTEDVTESVLATAFEPSSKNWSLLIETPHQTWATFADNRSYNDDLDPLHTEFPGEVLRTGANDANGVEYVWLWSSGKMVIDFRTDGKGWPTLPEDLDDLDDDEQDEDWGAVYRFETDLYPRDWPYTFPRFEFALQQLLVDFDAYVPYLGYTGRLTAAYGHEDAAADHNISRAHLVRLRQS